MAASCRWARGKGEGGVLSECSAELHRPALKRLVDHSIHLPDELMRSSRVLVHDLLERLFTSLHLVEQGAQVVILETPHTSHLLHHKLAIQKAGYSSPRVLGTDVEASYKSAVLGLVVCRMTNASGVFVQLGIALVEHQDRDGARTRIAATTAISYQRNSAYEGSRCHAGCPSRER